MRIPVTLLALICCCLTFNCAARNGHIEETSKSSGYSLKYLCYEILKLRKGNEANSPNAIRQLLGTYGFSEGDSIVDNPFLKVPPDFFKKTDTGTKFISNFGGLNVTAITEGLTSFVAERAKEELSLAFIKSFTEADPCNRLLFPETYRLLSVFASYNLSDVIISLRGAAARDLQQLSVNVLSLPKLADSCICCNAKNKKGKYLQVQNEFTQVFDPMGKDSLNLTFEIMGYVTNRYNIGDLVHAISCNPALHLLKPANGDSLNYTGNYLLADLLLQSVTVKDSSKEWISTSALDVILNDSLSATLYFAVLYQAARQASVTFYGSQNHLLTFAELLRSAASNNDSLSLWKNNIRNFSKAINAEAEKISVPLSGKENSVTYGQPQLSSLHAVSGISFLPVFAIDTSPLIISGIWLKIKSGIELASCNPAKAGAATTIALLSNFLDNLGLHNYVRLNKKRWMSLGALVEAKSAEEIRHNGER